MGKTTLHTKDYAALMLALTLFINDMDVIATPRARSYKNRAITARVKLRQMRREQRLHNRKQPTTKEGAKETQ